MCRPNMSSSSAGEASRSAMPPSRWTRTSNYKLVNTAEQIRHRIGSSWSEGSRHYRLQDGYYQFTLKEGRVEEPDYWRAQGTLIQDDQAIGQLEMRVSGTSGSLVLTLGDGETVLKSWD